MKTPTRIFSYYGGKSKIAHKYPAPLLETVIEPFAGGAAYSLMYHERQVWLNDLSPRTFALWSFLLRPDALDVIDLYVPANVRKGDNILDMLPADADKGLVELLRSEASQGSMGAKGTRNVVTQFGERSWNRSFRQRLDYWIPRIGHWRITNLNYVDVAHQSATWFIDPPYANKAGSNYAESDIDYSRLAEWCCSLFGQVIVCENVGAMWLPFQTLTDRRRGMETYNSSRVTAGGEAVFTMSRYDESIR